MLYTWHVIEKSDTFYISKRSSILYGNLLTSSNRIIDQAEIEQTICSTQFINLAVDTGAHHSSFIGKSEVLQEVNPFLCFLIGHNHCPPLNGIVNFSGMKREGTHITPIKN